MHFDIIQFIYIYLCLTGSVVLSFSFVTGSVVLSFSFAREVVGSNNSASSVKTFRENSNE